MSSTDPKQYSIELGQQRCVTIMQELVRDFGTSSQQPLLRRDIDLDCVLYTGKLTKDGHWQIQRRPRYLTRSSERAGTNHHRAYYVHRIAYVALRGADVGQTASHLCGRGNCINPHHIVDESIALNVARINCLGFVDCPRHHHRLATLCHHSPPCVKKPIAADRCCLDALEESGPASSPAPPAESPSVSTFDQFLAASQESSNWPSSSTEDFDPAQEIASPFATPPPVSTPPPISVPVPRPPPSPPRWLATDDRESQDTIDPSDYDDDEMLDDNGAAAQES